MGDPIDLSDLDPFAPPSRTSSPLFPSPAAIPSTSSTSAHRSTTPLPPPRLEPKLTGSDPLGSISLVNFAARHASSSKPPSPAPPPLPQFQADPVRAQEERKAAVWSDLTRQPWSAAPNPMQGGESVAGPSDSGGGMDQFDALGSGVSIASSSASHEHPTRRRSLSRSPTLSFSPPRRLSGLMEGAHPSLAARANSQTSRGETAVFHPSSPPVGDSSAFKRASFGLHQSGEASHTTAGEAGDSSFGEWTDFQTAISDAVADDFGFPVPTPPAPVPAPAPAPSAHPFSTSGFFSHSPIHFPSASTSSAKSTPSTKTPAPSASTRPPPKPSHTVPAPTNGHATAAGAAGPGSKGWKKEWTYDSSGADAIQGIKLLGVKAGTNKILSDDVAEGIRPHLPPRHRLSSKWTLLYSLDQHGTALSTLYSRVTSGLKGADGGCVLVIRDARGGTFGAYVSEALHEQQGYYGDGTCFLWKATPFPASDFRVGSSVRHFPPTGINSYFILSEGGFLSVGGGDGRFGLWVDSVLEKGVTGRCPCFGNEPLTAGGWEGEGMKEQGRFEVLGVECWGVGV